MLGSAEALLSHGQRMSQFKKATLLNAELALNHFNVAKSISPFEAAGTIRYSVLLKRNHDDFQVVNFLS